MLNLERRVVAQLTTTSDPRCRAEVEHWVEGSLREMPDVLRAGVLAESVLFTGLLRAWPGGSVEGLLARLDRSPIGLLRSYPRLFRSLVLFGELELCEATP